MSRFPAVLHLPVRLTQTEDANVGAVKNARGVLVGWTIEFSGNLSGSVEKGGVSVYLPIFSLRLPFRFRTLVVETTASGAKPKLSG